MATVYSLICWCGKSGKTVTFTDAGDVVNLASHGIRSGYPMPLVFTDNGNTLPSGLSKNTTYYGALGADSGKFLLFPTNADAIAGTNQITFSGTGSGTHKVKSAYYYALSSVSRWTLNGTEHVYDSMTSMVSGFSSAIGSTYDAVAEIVGQWDDVATSGVSITSVCNTLLVTTLVNGARSTAFHDRLFGAGYRVYSTSTSLGCVTAQSYGITLDGFEIIYGGATNNGSYMVAFGTLAGDLTVRNMLGSCASTGAIHGVQIATGVTAYNNIVVGIPGSTTYAAFRNTTGNLSRCYNNIAVGNPIGFDCPTGGGHGYFYNNIAVGNTVNWGARPLYSASKASHNACEDSDTITFTSSGSGSTLTFSSAHQYQGNTQIFLYSTGTLPTVGGVPLVQGLKYWVRSRPTTSTMTIGLTDGGTALTFDGAGTGTHYIYTVWGSETEKVVIDYSTPSGIFADPTTTLDFTPASVTAPQVETGTVLDWFYGYDLRGNTFPAYSGSGYNTAITAGSFVAGLSYTIVSVGTTDFTLIGAASNTVGVTFKSTGVGSGTGTATLNAKRDLGAIEYDLGYGNWPVSWDISWDISGSTVRIFDTGTQTLVDSTTSGTTLSASGVVGGSVYDVTVTKPGYLNVRLTGITASDGLTTTITQEVDFAYLASSGLTYETNADINTGAKEFSLTAASSVQNWYSFWIETWHTDPDFYNTDFPLQANGPYSIKLLNDYTMDDSTSIGYLNTGGIAYVDSSSVTTDFWMCLQTSGVPAGMTVKWEFSDGGTVQSAASTGDINQLVSIYAGSGSTDYTGYCVLKVQGEDGSSNLYNQVETDLVSQFGTLSDTLYVLGMTPTDTGVDYSAPGGTPTITDHGASPVTWHGKSFSITIQSDLSGDNILRYLRHNATLTISAGSDDQFNWHDFIQPNGSGYKSVRGYVYGDTGATLKGVKVVTSGGDDHPDFNLFTADDGSTYTPAVSASISITGMPTATGASTRLQIINYTASQASTWQATTAYAQGDVVLRTTGVGTESTAGLYMRATTGGTSGGTEPTWDTTVGNTTADGTVTWTTYAVLYYDADPVTSSYSSTYVDGEEILAGETVKIRFAEMDAGTSFKTYSTSLVAASSGFSAAVDTTADSVYATWGLDGSSYDSTYSPDYVANYLILDTNTDFSGKSAGAYFCYLLTTSQGMYLFWGGMTLIDSGNIRINDSVLDMYFDESDGFVKQTDSVRIFRDDGTRPAIDPTTGGSGIEINWRVPVNVVSTGGSALTAEESAYLLALPSAADVWASGTRTLTSGGGGASVDDIYSDPRSLTLPKFIALK